MVFLPSFQGQPVTVDGNEWPSKRSGAWVFYRDKYIQL